MPKLQKLEITPEHLARAHEHYGIVLAETRLEQLLDKFPGDTSIALAVETVALMSAEYAQRIGGIALRSVVAQGYEIVGQDVRTQVSEHGVIELFVTLPEVGDAL